MLSLRGRGFQEEGAGSRLCSGCSLHKGVSFTTFLLCWGLGGGQKTLGSSEILPPSVMPCASVTIFSTCPEALCSCVSALNHLDMPRMSLNHPIISVFWALSSLLGHCQLLAWSTQGCSQGWRGKRGLLLCPGNSGRASSVAEGARGGRKTHRGSSSGLSTCLCHVSALASPRHSEVSCSVPDTLLALGPAFGQPCLLASHPASPPG